MKEMKELTNKTYIKPLKKRSNQLQNKVTKIKELTRPIQRNHTNPKKAFN